MNEVEGGGRRRNVHSSQTDNESSHWAIPPPLPILMPPKIDTLKSYEEKTVAAH